MKQVVVIYLKTIFQIFCGRTEEIFENPFLAEGSRLESHKCRHEGGGFYITAPRLTGTNPAGRLPNICCLEISELCVGSKNSQNYWVPEHFPLSGILNKYIAQCFGNWVCFRLQVRGSLTKS
jgi:hypothetical protein